MKVAVVGSWHLASVFSACLADLGHQVTGVDTESNSQELLKNGLPPVFEPGLEEVLKRNIAAGRLSFTTDFPGALRDVSVAVLAIDTQVTPTGVNTDSLFA